MDSHNKQEDRMSAQAERDEAGIESVPRPGWWSE